MLFGNGLVGDYTFAAQLEEGAVFSTQCHLPPTPNVHYSACLMVRAPACLLPLGESLLHSTYQWDRTVMLCDLGRTD